MGNNITVPTKEQPIVFTTYKQCIKADADAYMQKLLQYNAIFTNLARWDGAAIVLAIDPAQLFYNPPRPAPWVSSQVDVFFEQDILTYNFQLKRITEPANRTNQSMVKVINTPPVPPPAPEYIVLATGAAVNPATPVPGAVPGILPNPTPVLAPPIPQLPLPPKETDINRKRYIQMYLFGQKYLLPSQKYADAVIYSPPAAGAEYGDALKQFMILYEQIRGLHALNTGGEVFTMKFIAPLKGASEGFASFSRSLKEGFSNNAVIPTQCVDVNTAQENWYFNQIIDIQGKRDLQRQLCISKGLTYDASNCRIRQCVKPLDADFTEADEPATGKLYNYNQIKFSASAYPSIVDNTEYKKLFELNPNLQLQDIDKYYIAFNAYNFFWREQHGWRAGTQDAPYNPPIAPWINTTSPTTEDQIFLNAVRDFNTRASALIGRLNAFEPLNLPADFGEFPDPPAYPNELYEALKRPANYVRPAAASSIPVSNDPTRQQIQYQIPINQVPDIYKALKETPRPPPAPPVKPKCSDASGGACIIYDDEVSDAAKKVLANMQAVTAQRMQSASIQYAMSKPKVVNDIMDDKLTALYNKMKPDLLENVKKILGRN